MAAYALSYQCTINVPVVQFSRLYDTIMVQETRMASRSEGYKTEHIALQMLRICSAPSLLYQVTVYQAVVSSGCFRIPNVPISTTG